MKLTIKERNQVKAFAKKLVEKKSLNESLSLDTLTTDVASMYKQMPALGGGLGFDGSKLSFFTDRSESRNYKS